MNSRSTSDNFGSRPICVQEFNRLKELLKHELANHEGKFVIHFSTETVYDLPFLVLNVMYLVANNEFRCRLIAMKSVDYGLPVRDTARLIDGILNEYGMANKIFCFTTIDPSPATNVANYLVRNASTTLRIAGRPMKAFCVFSALHEVLKKLTDLVSPFSNEIARAKEICRENEIHFRSLFPRIPDDFYEVGGHVYLYPNIIEGTNHFKMTLSHQREMKRYLHAMQSDFIPTNESWFMCNMLSTLLQRVAPTFQLPTQVFPSSHLVVRLLNEIVNEFAFFEALESDFSTFVRQMKEKFNSVFCDLPVVFMLASVFNPVHKMVGTFSMMDSIAATTGIQFHVTQERITEELRDLYNAYAYRFYADIQIPELTLYELTQNPEALLDDPIDWWDEHKSSYPILSSIARDILTVPASLHSMRAQVQTLTYDNVRRRIRPLNQGSEPLRAQAHICVQQWLGEPIETVFPEGIRNCSCRFAD